MKSGEIVQLSPLVRRITAGISSVFTGPGTNTYLIGAEEITVLDPGPAINEHIQNILNSSKNLKQIVVTHTHPDHSPGTKLLQNELDIKLKEVYSDLNSWQKTLLARHEERPKAKFFIDNLFEYRRY